MYSILNIELDIWVFGNLFFYFTEIHLYLAYVSIAQWDFLRNVSLLCSMLQLSNKQSGDLIMNCLRPLTGRYVTFYNRQFATEYVNEIKIYGERKYFCNKK
jgi:hypothetical protein